MFRMTVVIPVYNKIEYLSKCLESVLSQSLENIEILCIDDGSTDGSLELLCEYAEKNEIVLYQHNHNGAAAARNLGIEQSHGEYIAFMDADDFYYDELVLEKLYKSAKSNRVSLCAGNMVLVHKDGNRSDFKFRFIKNGLCSYKESSLIYGQTTFVFRREFLVKHELKYPDYIQFEDPPFLLKVITTAQEYYAITDNVYCYRVGINPRTVSYKRAIDILAGVRDCYLLANKYHLQELYRMQLRYLLDDLLEYYFQYVTDDKSKIAEVLDEIGCLSKRFNDDYKGVDVYSYKSFKEYVEHIRLMYRKALKGVVIYGAGGIAKQVLDSHVLPSIKGIAVTNKGKETKLAGYDVRCICDYEIDSYVVICANERNADEMEKVLMQKGFFDYDTMEENKIMIMKAISKEVTG